MIEMPFGEMPTCPKCLGTQATMHYQDSYYAEPRIEREGLVIVCNRCHYHIAYMHCANSTPEATAFASLPDCAWRSVTDASR